MFEEKIEAAILTELERQAEERPQAVQVRRRDNLLKVEGEIDVAALATAVALSLAGGP
jgi:hypothetical protein